MRLLPLFLLLVSAGSAAAAVAACSDQTDPASATNPTSEAGAGSETSTRGDGATGEDGAATDGAVPLDDSGCTPAPANLDGGGACGTMEFGALAAPFGEVDGSAPYAGGVLPAGIYDAVGAERLSANGGSWRETFVFDGNGRFTRIRQIRTSASDASVGPVTRRSGTYTVSGTEITFKEDCAQSNGTMVDAGSDTLPYEAVPDGKCGAFYRYGATGIRITLKRR